MLTPLTVDSRHAEVMHNPRVVMHREDGSWMHFDNPVNIIATNSVARVVPLLHQIEAAVARGLFAAGFIGYEASPAFDASLSAHPADALPLIWFGLFKKPRITRALPSAPTTVHNPVAWQPTTSAEFGTGGGIVWESTAASEFRECRIKAAMVTTPQNEFSLIETLLWRAGSGFFLLDAHLDRLMGSAHYFGFAGDRQQIKNYLKRCLEPEQVGGDARVRITVDRAGQVSSSITSLANHASGEHTLVTLSLATVPVDATNLFLFHKTTERSHFLEALGECCRSDDLIFYNECKEITETSRGNIVVELDGKLVTPPVSCGLLPGVFRASLLNEGAIKEAIIKLDDLPAASKIFRINSVRTWQSCVLI